MEVRGQGQSTRMRVRDLGSDSASATAELCGLQLVDSPR